MNIMHCDILNTITSNKSEFKFEPRLESLRLGGRTGLSDVTDVLLCVASTHACFNVALTRLLFATSTGDRPLSSTKVTSAPCFSNVLHTTSLPLSACVGGGLERR